MAELLFSQLKKQGTDLVFGEQGDGLPTVSGSINAVISLNVTAPVVNNPAISTPLTSNTLSAWQSADAKTIAKTSSWEESQRQRSTVANVWQSGLTRESNQQAVWQAKPVLNAVTAAVWERAAQFMGAAPASWTAIPQAKQRAGVLWQKARIASAPVAERFTYPPQLNDCLTASWDEIASAGIARALPFTWPAERSIQTALIYEYAGLPALGTSQLFTPTEPVPEPVSFGSPDLLFIGERVDSPSIVFGALLRRPQQTIRVIRIMATIELTRLSDGAPIECNEVNWEADADSWGWRFDAVLPRDSDLAIVSPTVDGPVDVRCLINGHEFIGMVEGYETERQFGEKRYRINGRSRTAWLAAPYAPKSSSIVTSSITAQQICAAVLENTGFTLEWLSPDWIVPANVFSYQALEPIAVIKRVAESIGSIVQSDRATKTLRVLPRYAISPHQWATPSLYLSLSEIERLGADYRRMPAYNRAIVAGSTEGGVIVQATRDGTAGDELAPHVIDSLITDVTAGRERARNEIAKGGQWEDIRIATYLPEGGLIEPCTLIQVDDTTPFIGQTSLTQVNATSTATSVNVSQTIHIERYLGIQQ
ncbi:MAG: hypothetical protein ACPGPF_00035 [Pontibacterium sp.]